MDLWVPAGHTLPLFAKIFPAYGQNLVRVAAFLGCELDRKLRIIDVGSNIGDSARQIAASVDCEVLCIEGDPVWLPFLQKNTHDLPVVIEPVFLNVGAANEAAVVRSGGTSKLVPSGGGSPPIKLSTVDDVLNRNRAFNAPDLIKSDTDGYDCLIVSEFLRAGIAGDPVIFFEYDPWMTQTTGNPEAAGVWAELSNAQYEHVVVWDNFGHLLGTGRVGEMLQLASCFESSRRERGYDYWDVAVLKDDQGGRLARLRAHLEGEEYR